MNILEILAAAFDAAAERAAAELHSGTTHWTDQHNNPAAALTPVAVLAARNKDLFEELAAIARGEDNGRV